MSEKRGRCDYMRYANNEEACWNFEYDRESRNDGNTMVSPQSMDTLDNIKRMSDELTTYSSKGITNEASEADMLLNLRKMIASLEETKNKLEIELDHKDAYLKCDIQVEEALSRIPPNTADPIYRGQSKLL